MTDKLLYSQEDINHVFDELGELRVELDDDPLSFGPKRLNSKTSQVRRMLDRCERLFLNASRKQQATKRSLREAETDLDLAKKYLFANDPDTRSGRSVSDREAIAAGKLDKEIRIVHDLNVISQDLEAVLVVIKAKRADLKDTEGRLRDQIRLCSEEIGLGGRWGSRVPGAPDIHGSPAFKTATGRDVEELEDLISSVDGEIKLSRDSGDWSDPVDISVPTVVADEHGVVDEQMPDSMAVSDLASTIAMIMANDKVEVSPEFFSNFVPNLVINQIDTTPDLTPPVVVAPEPEVTEEVHIDSTPSVVKDQSVTMASTVSDGDVDAFLDDKFSFNSRMEKADTSKFVDDLDVNTILDMFESHV